MPTRNLAIMSTDIVGSSGTTQALDRESYREFRADYERVVRTAIESCDGRVFKSLGDGFLAAFDSSTNAVLSGLSIEEQIGAQTAARRWDARFATRIGISSGDVTVEQGDCFGVPVIVATRVQSLADVNTTWFTESVYQSMNRREVSYDELGAMSLKGLEDAVRMYRARPRGAPAAAETLAALLTDTRGFTGLVDDGGAGVEATFAAYDELVFTYALRHGGLLRYNYADQYLFTFREARGALAAARDLLNDPDGLLRQRDVRIGICGALGIGQLRLVAGRYLGSLISQQLPRLVGRAPAGQVIAAEQFVDAVALEVDIETTFDAVETAHLKGHATPLAYRALRAGVAS